MIALRSSERHLGVSALVDATLAKAKAVHCTTVFATSTELAALMRNHNRLSEVSGGLTRFSIGVAGAVAAALPHQTREKLVNALPLRVEYVVEAVI